MTQSVMTADELLRLEMPGKCMELVRGQLLVREPPGFLHGRVAQNLARLIGNHVHERQLGLVLAAETGFKLAANPDTVRAPDVAFVSNERVPHPAPAGYAALAPDLVVEVLSPDDRPGYVLAKVGDWLIAGARLAWVVDPRKRTARVFRADGTDAGIDEDDTLDGEDVLPDFTVKLRAILS